MSLPRLPSVLGLAFVCSTLAATFAQCDEEPRQGAQAARQPQDPPRQDPQSNAPPPDMLHLLISGAMLGRLEPCGCASGQLGGLARRMQHVGERSDYDLLLEGGNLLGGADELDSLKLLTTATVLFGMQRSYDALGVAADDLLLPRGEWNAMLAAAPVLATNLTSNEPDWPGRPFLDKSVRTLSARIGSLMLDELPPALRAEDSPLRRLDPATAWHRTFADCGPDVLRIVMLHGKEAPILELVPKLDPPPDLAIAVEVDYVEPDASPTMIGDVPLVFSGIRGRVLLDAQLWRENGKPRVACTLVPLPASKTAPGGGGDPQVKDLILEHRHIVQQEDVLTKLANRTPTPNGAGYVGSETCRTCHQAAYDVWANSKHSHAWQTLVDAEQDPKRYGWPVTAYPDCVSCHVVGYGQQSGFVSPSETPHLFHVGCEQCHGAGSAHVQSGGQQKLGIARGEQASVMCTRCHDYEQSPEFVYKERWALIQHGR